MYDAEGRLVVSNRKYKTIYDLPDELLVPGTPHSDISAYRVEHGLVMVGTLQSFMDRHSTITSSVPHGITLVQTHTGAFISIHHENIPEGGWVATHWEVTDDLARVVALEERERELGQQNLRLDAAVNNMAQGLCMFDADGRLVISNAPFRNLYGLTAALTEPGTLVDDMRAYRESAGLVSPGDPQLYLTTPHDLEAGTVSREEFALADGRVVATTYQSMRGGGWVATHEDVTLQRQQQDRIRHLARYDALTDLPNRASFAEELSAIESRVARGQRWALLYFDLDHFKSINDTLGHSVGDALLKDVAARINAARRESDVVARLGGDEFALLAGPLDRPDDAAAIAQRLVDSIAAPFHVGGHDISIGASIGIAVAPDDGSDISSIMRNADLALYRAKAEGRGNFQFFEAGMNAALQERRFLERGIRAALALKQLRLVYQPLVQLEDNTIACFEALLRWDHPERGLIPPDVFIPIAEEIGAMASIGAWVVREACSAAAAWPDHVRIAVNLSPAQFRDRDLVAHVVHALEASGLPGDRLELEITESLLLANTEATMATLHKLRDLGIRISMDDFGTGYSSLSYLRSFPFDKIKIDRSFIKDVESHPDSMAIVQAVVGLGASLGMATTAEGVETDEELRVVREQGCQQVQGYLFSRPLTASAATELIQKFSHTPALPKPEPETLRRRA